MEHGFGLSHLDWVPIITAVIFALVAEIYRRRNVEIRNDLQTLREKIIKLENWKDARPTELLTVAAHQTFCSLNYEKFRSRLEEQHHEVMIAQKEIEKGIALGRETLQNHTLRIENIERIVRNGPFGKLQEDMRKILQQNEILLSRRSDGAS